MIRMASVALAALALFLFNPLQGQQKIGEALPDKAFKLPGVDDKDHSNTDYKKDVLVICITCNSCPVARAYENRMIEFTKKFSAKADLVAISVNTGEANKFAKMKERAASEGFNFPYLYDESQAIAKSLGATVTPHFFVFDKNRKLVYKGAMDDNTEPDSVKNRYLESAVNAAAEGKAPEMDTTKAVGCGISYKKK